MPAEQPQQCFDAGCPLAGVAKGFTLGAGDPQRAKYAYILEAPGRDELSFGLTPTSRAFLPSAEECEKELAIRRRDYPTLEARFIRYGVPVVGATGLALNFWIWSKVGIRREEVYIDNVLRCLPPKSKNGSAYPTGDVRKAAEQCCRQYDRLDMYLSGDYLVCQTCKRRYQIEENTVSLLRKIFSSEEILQRYTTERFFAFTSRKGTILLTALRDISQEKSSSMQTEDVPWLQENLYRWLQSVPEVKEQFDLQSLSLGSTILFQQMSRQISSNKQKFQLDYSSKEEGCLENRGEDVDSCVSISKNPARETGAILGSLFSKSSECAQEQIYSRASSRDGEEVKTLSGKERICTPQERNQNGQSPREFGNSWGWSTFRAGALSSLPKEIFDQIVCPFDRGTVLLEKQRAAALVSIHPAALLRDIVSLPLCVKDAEKARDFTSQNIKIISLLGGKSSHAFLRYADNVIRWRGHYQALKENWIATYKSLFDFKAKAKKVKVEATKPDTLAPEPCKSFKRYKGKKPPKCGCEPCWTKYEENQKCQSTSAPK